MNERIFLFIAVLVTLQFGNVKAQKSLTNQRIFDTISFIPEHYKERVAQFEKEPVVKNRIIFLGNSITEGGNWKELLGDSTVINRGIGGDITFGVLKRLNDIIRRQPSKLFLLIGINDIGKDIPDAVIADNIGKIIRQVHLKCPATKIYLQSILPVNREFPGFPQHYDKSDHVISVNHLLIINAKEMGCTFVDIYPLFVDPRDYLDQKYATDGLHLNLQGYEVWVKYLKDKHFL